MEIIEAIRERYQQRIQEVADGLAKSRVKQKCALLLQRLVVAEQIDRLGAAVEEVARVLDLDTAVDRRFEFLMQELNREANTLGSYSAHIDTAGTGLNLKVLIATFSHCPAKCLESRCADRCRSSSEKP